MNSKAEKMKQFCLIQLQIISNREERLRKDLLDCKIQKEYLSSVLLELGETPIKDNSLQSLLLKGENKS